MVQLHCIADILIIEAQVDFVLSFAFLYCLFVLRSQCMLNNLSAMFGCSILIKYFDILNVPYWVA